MVSVNDIYDRPSVSGVNQETNEYKVLGQDAISLKFVPDVESMENAEEYHPEFVHQHFGDSEYIVGYKNLKVTLYYSNQSMYIYPEIAYDGNIKEKFPDLEPDDIITKLKEQLPNWQMDAMVTSKDEFKRRLTEQKALKLPEGQQIGHFRTNGKEFDVFKVTECSDDFDKFVTRTQTLALWYIDAADYTDNSDPRFNYYFLYEVAEEPGTKDKIFKVAGYAVFCNYHAYLEKIRPRVAQILLLPQYRKSGNGAKFLQALYDDFVSQDKVVDITAEDPADAFIYLRDFVDCSNCRKLEEFAPEKLKKGFSKNMKDVARNKLKIHPRQARRVYEILRFMSTDASNAEDLKSYRADVTKRLELPMKRERTDWNKITKILNKEEVSVIAQSEENQAVVLDQMYKQTMEEYNVVIQRLKTHG